MNKITEGQLKKLEEAIQQSTEGTGLVDALIDRAAGMTPEQLAAYSYTPAGFDDWDESWGISREVFEQIRAEAHRETQAAMKRWERRNGKA